MIGDISIIPLNLIEDEPVYNDGLGLLPHAKVIAGTAIGTKGPFNIGIYGNWGQGKSSVLKIVKNLLDVENGSNDVTTVWFNAWQYEKEEHPIIPLIACIVGAIDDKISNENKVSGAIKKNLSKLGRILRAAAYGFSAKAKVTLPGYPELEAGFVAKEMIDRYEKLKLTNDPLLDKSLYFKAFDRLSELNKDTIDSELPKIVVLVDDLDRCLPSQAFKLLEGIKLALNQPGFVFILAVDRRILEGYLTKKYIDEGVEKFEECGNQYLDKIIQLPLFIPNHESRFGDFIEHLIKNNSALNSEENKEIRETITTLKEVLSIGSDYNPRALIRFVNNLIVDRQLLNTIFGKNIDIAHIEICAVSRILREHLKDDYKVLIETKGLIEALISTTSDDVSDVFARIKPTEKVTRLFKKFERDAFLVKVIHTSVGNRWGSNDRIRKRIDNFIKMKQEDIKDVLIDDRKLIEEAIESVVEMTPDQNIWDVGVMNKIVSLDLSLTNFGDVGMRIIEGFRNIAMLDLSDTKITDKGMTIFKENKKLTSLDISSTEISDEGVKYLEGLENLKSLVMYDTKITDKGMRCLENLMNLEILDVSDNNITDMGMQYLRTLKNIKEIDLSDTKITGGGLKHLRESKGIKILSVANVNLQKGGMKFIGELKSLDEINLSKCGINDDELMHLKSLTNLTQVSLRNNTITNHGINFLLSFNDLKNINLSNTKITDEGMKQLANFKKIEILRLNNTLITDKGLEAIADLRNLKILNLSSTQITDEAIKHLKGMKNLARLELSNTKLTNKSLKYLADLENLRILSVVHTKISKNDFETLRERNKQLRINN